MLYRITLISEEIEDFILEFKLDSDATFFDLHKLILKTCRYVDEGNFSFFICNEVWDKETEITLEDNGNGYSDEDIYLMQDTPLSEFLEDERQRFMYRFDAEDDRDFLLELTEISFGESIDEPCCSRKHGLPPMQIMLEEEDIDANLLKDIGLNKSNITISGITSEDDEDAEDEFYGSEDFDSEEFDPEGFEIEEGNSIS
ncbi:MAG: hypothetical protein II222_03745 [Paraprevotella sp.]|nr:hypothetical protein [Paraprevotella sp.]